MAADVLRALTFMAGGGAMLTTLLVVAVYLRRYVRDLQLARAQGKKLAWRGLLPAHVALIGLAYTGLQLVCLNTVYQQVHRPLRWQTVVISASTLLGVTALWVLSRHQRRLYPRHDETPPQPPPLLVDADAEADAVDRQGWGEYPPPP